MSYYGAANEIYSFITSLPATKWSETGLCGQWHLTRESKFSGMTPLAVYSIFQPSGAETFPTRSSFKIIALNDRRSPQRYVTSWDNCCSVQKRLYDRKSAPTSCHFPRPKLPSCPDRCPGQQTTLSDVHKKRQTYESITRKLLISHSIRQNSRKI